MRFGITTSIIIIFLLVNPIHAENPIINHIENLTNCSEYESSLILALMANHSVDQEGFHEYCLYYNNDYNASILYNKSLRFHNYVNNWDEFALSWSNKSLEEKGVALNVKTSIVDDFNNLLDNADVAELSYILNYTLPSINQLIDISNEIVKCNKLDVGKIIKLSNNIDTIMNTIFNKANTAHYMYLIDSQNINSTDWDYIYISNLVYNDTNLSSRDKINKLNKIKDKYDNTFDTLNNQYSLIDGCRRDINTYGQTLTSAGVAMISSGVGMIIGGAVSTAETFGATSGLIIAGSIVVGCGSIMVGFGGTLIGMSKNFVDISFKLQKQIEQLYPLKTSADSYIDSLIEQLD